MKARSTPQILALLPIRKGGPLAIHRQLYDALRRAILEGLLRPGQRIPSTRALAIELGVSRLPVLMAYEQLLHEGYLRGKTGSGTFVSPELPDDVVEPWASDRTRGRASHAHQALRVRADVGLGPFRMSQPALDQFPHETWARIVARHARASKPSLMAYGDPAGVPVLRTAIAEYLRTSRAVRCEADQVLMVSGSQAALTLCATVILGTGDQVAVEEPGYAGSRAALQSNGAELVPVAVDSQGIDVAALDRLGRRVKAVYITPSHQYPLGTSMSAARRLALLEWAQRRDAWIIEDDYDSEYRYVSRPLGALQGMRSDARVIYIGTFSKVLFPAIRLGYLVVPRALWRAFVEARETFDLFSPTLYQVALGEFIDDGHFGRHLRRMRTLYMRRRDALLEGLDRFCGDTLTVHCAEAGFYLATFLSRGHRDVEVAERMKRASLWARPLSSCYVSRPVRQGLLLGFGGWDERRLLAATRTLGELLHGGK